MGREIYGSPTVRARYQRGSITVGGKARKFWRGSYYTYYMKDGKECRKHERPNLGYCSEVKKWDARKELERLIEDAENAQRPKPEARTLNWFWENKFLLLMRPGWEEPTRKGNESDYKLYIAPRMGDKILADIDQDMCIDYVNSLVDKGLSKPVIARAKTLLSSMFRLAKHGKKRLIVDNPLELVRMPKAVKDSARPVIEREQLEELLSNVTALRDWCILGIAIFGESRSEELFALTWPLVGADYVDIENSCWHGEFRPGKLKNDASKRRVFLPETIM